MLLFVRGAAVNTVWGAVFNKKTKSLPGKPGQAFFIIKGYGLIIIHHFYNFRIGLASILIDLRNADVRIFSGIN